LALLTKYMTDMY